MKKNKINEEEVFEINKDYSVTIKKVGRKQTVVVVVDDFLAAGDFLAATFSFVSSAIWLYLVSIVIAN